MADRLASWRSEARVGVLVLVLVAVVAGIIWYRLGVNSGDVPPIADRPTPSHAASVSSAVTTRPRTKGLSSSVTTSTALAGSRMTVHVAGSVLHPGVIELPVGARHRRARGSGRRAR